MVTRLWQTRTNKRLTYWRKKSWERKMSWKMTIRWSVVQLIANKKIKTVLQMVKQKQMVSTKISMWNRLICLRNSLQTPLTILLKVALVGLSKPMNWVISNMCSHRSNKTRKLKISSRWIECPAWTWSEAPWSRKWWLSRSLSSLCAWLQRSE